MKTKKFVFALAGICLLFFVTGPAMAGPPSAKFAATWTIKPGLESAVVITDDEADKVMVTLILLYLGNHQGAAGQRAVDRSFRRNRSGNRYIR